MMWKCVSFFYYFIFLSVLMSLPSYNMARTLLSSISSSSCSFLQFSCILPPMPCICPFASHILEYFHCLVKETLLLENPLEQDFSTWHKFSLLLVTQAWRSDNTYLLSMLNRCNLLSSAEELLESCLKSQMGYCLWFYSLDPKDFTPSNHMLSMIHQSHQR